MYAKTKEKKLEHSPTLNTVLMVEDVLASMNESTIKISKLKQVLPKQVNHNTLKIILEYLEDSNKIMFSSKGISWIHNNSSKLKNEIEKGLEV